MEDQGGGCPLAPRSINAFHIIQFHKIPEPFMKISIGFSRPNDTFFIFDALVNGLIDTGDLELDAPARR